MSDDYDDYDDYEEAYEEGYEEGYDEGRSSRNRNNGGRSSRPSNEGCYIATSVYGSYDCPEVWTLRRFRDYNLKKSLPGRTFVKLYYAVSPGLVKAFGNISWLKRFTARLLNPFVKHLQASGFEDTPYEDPRN